MNNTKTGKTFGYTTIPRELVDSQLETRLAEFVGRVKPDDIVVDIAGSTRTIRTEYKILKTRALREGDKVIFSKTADISKDAEQIAEELDDLEAMGVKVEFLHMTNVTGKEIAKVMNALVYEDFLKMEEKQLINRYRKKNGGRGRPKIVKPAEWNSVLARVTAGEISAREAWESMNLSRGTYYRLKADETLEA